MTYSSETKLIANLMAVKRERRIIKGYWIFTDFMCVRVVSGNRRCKLIPRRLDEKPISCTDPNAGAKLFMGTWYRPEVKKNGKISSN